MVGTSMDNGFFSNYSFNVFFFISCPSSIENNKYLFPTNSSSDLISGNRRTSYKQQNQKKHLPLNRQGPCTISELYRFSCSGKRRDGWSTATKLTPVRTRIKYN